MTLRAEAAIEAADLTKIVEQQATRADLLNRATRLTRAIASRTGEIKPKEQKQIGRLVGLVPDVVASMNPVYMSALELAVSSAMNGRHEVAKRIADDLQSRVWTPLRWILLGLLGLLAVVAVALPFGAAVVASNERPTWFPQWLDFVVIAALAGTLGAVASILLRLRQLAVLRGRTRLEMITYGATRPLLGLLLGLFAYAVLASNLLPVNVEDTQTQALTWFAIAFVAGFSERFGADIASRLETRTFGEPTLPAEPA